jgi:TnpA family transposase
MNLLDILFAPRIKDVGSQQIYTMNTRREYAQRSYPLLPDSRIDTDLIIAQWEDILRLMVTLKSGKTTAYRIFKRLSSYARQNPLHQALKEYGKIIKSGFILRYFDDMALRQAIEKQLSRIELVNRFSKAVFFGNNQEFSVGLKEDQEKIVHARRLIQNAIIVWNYLYLSQLMSQLTKQGEIEALVDAIRQGTAVVWQHVNMQGEYDFNKLLKNKTSRFNLEAIFNLKVPD